MSLPPRSATRDKRFALGLALVTGTLAVGLLLLLALFLRQGQGLHDKAQLQADSVTELTFELEREFLRLRKHLHQSLAQPQQADWEQLQARYELFASRLELMHSSAAVTLLRQRPEFDATAPRLQALLVHFAPYLREPWLHVDALRALLGQMDALGPEVQALSLSANSLMTHQMADKLALVQRQQRWVSALIVLQVIVVLSAASFLYWRHRRQMRAQRALERVNDDLRLATERAEQADLAKSQFLANMSHELRTPLNGVLGMLDLLQDSPLSPAQRDQIVLARQSSRHLLRIINDVLDLSALDAGEVKIQPEPLRLPTLAQEALDLLQAQAHRKGLLLRAQLPSAELPWVLADATRVRQVLLNLLSNAIKFTLAGEVVLELSHASPNPQRIAWRIAVRDSGVGLSAAEIAQLFQRFRQVDNGISRRFGGTGLGLEISRSLARLMGGDITVDSTPGQGSVFTFTLDTPLCAPPTHFAPSRYGVLFADDALALAAENGAATALTPAAAAASLSPGLHVLVAEDHPPNRTLLRLLLERLGHRASFAENGAQALQLAQTLRFDAILMDLHMPEMDGLRSAAAIRALEGGAGRVPIIALSADVMPETQQRVRQVGMNAFLSKPVLREALQSVLAQCVAAAAPAADAGLGNSRP